MSKGAARRWVGLALVCGLAGALVIGCGQSERDRYAEWRGQYQRTMKTWLPSQAELEKDLGVKIDRVEFSDKAYRVNGHGGVQTGYILFDADLLAQKLDIPVPHVQANYFLEGYEDARIIIAVAATKTTGYRDKRPILASDTELWAGECSEKVLTPEEREGGKGWGDTFCRPLDDLPDRYIGYVEGGQNPKRETIDYDVFRDEFIVTTVEPSWTIAVSWLNLGEDVPLDIDLLPLMEDIEASVVKNKHVIENRIHKESTIPTSTDTDTASTEPNLISNT